MALAIAARVGALTISFPIGDAIDRVRVRLVRGLLQPAPDEILDVIVERIDFTLHRELGVLGRDVSGLAESRIVARHFIDAPTLNAIVVVGTEQHFRIHVPVGNESVVPLGRIAVLAAREKCRALFDQCLERFSGKEFQEHVLVLSISNREPILAKS